MGSLDGRGMTVDGPACGSSSCRVSVSKPDGPGSQSETLSIVPWNGKNGRTVVTVVPGVISGTSPVPRLMRPETHGVVKLGNG